MILDRLKQHGRVSVKEMSDTLRVSEVTIRQDLRALETGGLLERTYGGALLREPPSGPPELSFHTRLAKKRPQKEAIASAAAALVHEGDAIALDASTTVFALAGLLKPLRRLTIVTNSLHLANFFLDAPQIVVMLPGGRLRRDSISLVGRPEGLPDINLSMGFFGARGVSVLGGVSDVDVDEVAMKQAMVSRCVQSVVLLDGSKWGQLGAYTFLRLRDVARIVTTDDAPEALLQEVREYGVEVQAEPLRRRVPEAE
ncbi:MAG TPA: DeoR/GlpR family DNA-binding transcription regulator [Candidatus Limnocylindrales bacterium]|nr:DeoR/GlpR family DNA-binding transcription regulator [Candidatus Limnocylindrales bacterium]